MTEQEMKAYHERTVKRGLKVVANYEARRRAHHVRTVKRGQEVLAAYAKRPK